MVSAAGRRSGARVAGRAIRRAVRFPRHLLMYPPPTVMPAAPRASSETPAVASGRTCPGCGRQLFPEKCVRSSTCGDRIRQNDKKLLLLIFIASPRECRQARFGAFSGLRFQVIFTSRATPAKHETNSSRNPSSTQLFRKTSRRTVPSNQPELCTQDVLRHLHIPPPTSSPPPSKILCQPMPDYTVHLIVPAYRSVYRAYQGAYHRAGPGGGIALPHLAFFIARRLSGYHSHDAHYRAAPSKIPSKPY